MQALPIWLDSSCAQHIKRWRRSGFRYASEWRRNGVEGPDQPQVEHELFVTWPLPSAIMTAMLDTLMLALLGNPELHRGGQPVGRFRSAKAYALLYYLAVTRRAQSRTVLAGLFWGDMEEYYARRNFNRTLSDLVQFVGDHLVIERQTVAFAREQPYWLDVEVLENAATMLPSAENFAELAAAANLYRGDFLDGFYVQDAPEFEQWVLGERARLCASALHLLHTLAHYAAEQGDLTQAMEYARRTLQLEPWREEAHRLLILLLAQSGQRSAALAQYELCCQALRSELDVEPDAATLDLVAQIRAGKVEQVTNERVIREQATAVHPVIALPPHTVTHNLPGQRTPFIGRQMELTEITRLLVEEDCRLLTLVGPGGIGKTRLALRAVEQIVDTQAAPSLFADGLFFVPLEAISDGGGLVSAIIAALAEENGFPLHAAAPLQQQLLDFLRDKALLLLLDNFEHLLGDVDLLSHLLIEAPAIKILITSREAIGLQEAWFYSLAGLAFPSATLDKASPDTDYDAIHFFVQCARRTQLTFALDGGTGEHRAAVVRICQMVEGMPLAIELAAAWLKGMSPQQIVSELERGLDILTARFQNIPARHRSIRAVLDYSWKLLQAEERAVVQRLSVFLGSFQPEAAAEVAGASLLTLAVLVEKALVRMTPDQRYQIHALTRQYAAEHVTSTAAVALRNAHATYYAALLLQQRSHLFTAAYKQVFTIVAAESDNIRHAWQWIIDAIDQGRIGLPIPILLRQMAEVFATYHFSRSLYLSGQALFRHALDVMEKAGWDADAAPPDQQAIFVHLQLYTGLFHFEMGQFKISLDLAEKALDRCRALALEHDLALALLLYGRTQVRRGVHPAAITALQEALVLYRRLGSTSGYAETLIGLGISASHQGHYAQAQTYFQELLTLGQEVGYQPWVVRALTSLGTIYGRQQDYRHARPYYEQALAIAQTESNQNYIMINTSNLGNVQRGLGNHRLSESYYKESLTLARSLSNKRWIAANLNGIALTYLEMGDLTAAERALSEAVTVAHYNESTPDTLGSIALLGNVWARRGQLETALKALIFAEQHPATMARDRLYNQSLLMELRSELAPVLLEQAAAWAANQTLDHMVYWLLHGEGSLSMAVRPSFVEGQGQSVMQRMDGRG